MGKLYWSVVVVVLVSGLSIALYFGLEGKTVPLIRWSSFSNAAEVSNAVESRMRQELQPYQFYFLGPHPKKSLHLQSAINLAKWLKSQSSAIIITDSLMTELNPELRELNPELVLDLSKDKDRFVAGIKSLDPQQKIVVIAPNIYVTHFLDQSPVLQMQDELKGKKYIVLSFFNFPHSREEEKDFEFPCKTSETSATQLNLGCFILGQSRRFYRKSAVEGKVSGFLNLVRAQEYMFFLGK